MKNFGLEKEELNTKTKTETKKGPARRGGASLMTSSLELRRLDHWCNGNPSRLGMNP